MATTQPFTILALRLEETPELKALSDAGHRVIYGTRIYINTGDGGAEIPIDKLIGPDCWRLLPDQMKWLPLTLKEMRAAQPKVKKAKREKVVE